MTTTPLATPEDVAALWHPLSTAEETQVLDLIVRASAKLRQATPFDIDARMALFATTPTAPIALDPLIVADVVATIVKRFLVNVNGYASTSEGMGPYSRSGTFVNRYDKTGSDVRGAIQVTPADIEQLRPAVPAPIASTFQVAVPAPRVLLPRGYGARDGVPGVPVIEPDVWPGSGVE